MRGKLAQEEFQDWSEFREAVHNSLGSDFIGRASCVVWRGQRDLRWQLSSAWERYVTAQLRGIPRSEKHELVRNYQGFEQPIFLERFKNKLVGLPGAPTLEQLVPPAKIWAIGRHHGLITPLLDWSEKPFFALFFAVADLLSARLANTGRARGVRIKPNDAIALYRLDAPPEMVDGQSPFRDLKVVLDRYDGVGRLAAQHGLFTWLTSSTCLCLDEYLDSIDELGRLKRYILKGKAIADAAKDLDAHGIDWRTVFPDVNGAALSANTMLYEID
jgi:hypothetical protein